jgi:FkbM family methyltransferase
MQDTLVAEEKPRQTDRPVRNDLIMDVGMNNGDDTEFYLAKGFHVVAVEANPGLVEQAKKRFASQIESGRLTLYGVAISDRDGTVDFFEDLKDDGRGSVSREYAVQNVTARGSQWQRIEVPSLRMERILEECGVPHYLKIDIETADRLCLEALQTFSHRPRYVSFELNLAAFEDTFLALKLLWDLDYRSFKLVNQALHHLIRLPNPPREGDHVDFHFKKRMSGPFGEETPGPWLTIDQAVEKYFWLRKRDRTYIRLAQQGKVAGIPIGRWFSTLKAVYNSRFCSFVRDGLYRVRGHQPSGWYDLHARLDDSV